MKLSVIGEKMRFLIRFCSVVLATRSQTIQMYASLLIKSISLERLMLRREGSEKHVLARDQGESARVKTTTPPEQATCFRE